MVNSSTFSLHEVDTTPTKKMHLSHSPNSPLDSMKNIIQHESTSSKQISSSTLNTLVDDEDPDYESLPEYSSLAAQLCAGAFAGIMEHTVMFPVDAIKTRMQVSAISSHVYTGIIAAVSKITAREGASSLWKGLPSVIIGAGPAHAVHYAVYEGIKKTLLKDKPDTYLNHHPIITSVSGACATIANEALMTPFDVIKQRMQAETEVKLIKNTTGPIQTPRENSIFKFSSKIYQKEGLSAFYVSYPTTLFMNVPFSIINFTIYESISKILNPERKYDPMMHCVAGGVSGAFAAGLTTPLDCIKTLLQTKGLSTDSHVRNVNSLVGAAKLIYKKGGLSGFFRGLKPRVIYNMPSTAIGWTSYEMAKTYLYHFGSNRTDSIFNAE